MRHHPVGPEEWQKLRKDPRSAIVVLAVIVAGVAAMLALLGILLGSSRASDRSTPLYWALLLPFAWWAASLANYAPWALRAILPTAAAFVIVAFLSCGVAIEKESGIILWVIAAVTSGVGAMTAWFLYSGSMIARRND